MKILLLGGMGYIGGAVVARLWDKHQLTIVDRLDFEVNPDFLNMVIKRTKFVKADISHIEVIYPLLKSADVVVNLCSLSLKDSATNQTEAIMTNEVMGKLIGDICHELKKRYIYLSTCSNYGVSDKLADELSELLPVSLYAITKVNTERYLLNNIPEALILRCATAFGYSPARIRYDVILNEFVSMAKKTKRIEIFQPNAYRPIIHVDDIAQAIELVCLTAPKFPILNVGKTNSKKIDLANAVAKETGAKIKEIKSEDPRNYRVNFSRIESLGYKPVHSIQSGIKEIMKY